MKEVKIKSSTFRIRNISLCIILRTIRIQTLSIIIFLIVFFFVPILFQKCIGHVTSCSDPAPLLLNKKPIVSIASLLLNNLTPTGFPMKELIALYRTLFSSLCTLLDFPFDRLATKIDFLN